MGRYENGATPIVNDGPHEMRALVDAMLSAAVPLVCHDSCCCCCCAAGGGPSNSFAWLAQRMDAGGLAFFHLVIWDKANPGMGWRYRRQHELLMVAHLRGRKLSWAANAKPVGNVFRGFLPGQMREHPNEKPLWLVEGFVARHTDPGELVLDPLMGGGTTGVAALNFGRRFIGIEIDPVHFETACRRIGQAHAQAQSQPRLIAEPVLEQTAFDLICGAKK